MQQRLSEAAWKKTIDKMRKFGAPLSDEEASAVVAYAARRRDNDGRRPHRAHRGVSRRPRHEHVRLDVIGVVRDHPSRRTRALALAAAMRLRDRSDVDQR